MISVIITTCNREVEILKEAIDSVINQTYKDIEIIVVNDSPDSKYRKDIDKLVFTYNNKVRYFVNNIKKGANYSRNFGIDNSMGDFISLLDDDDYWDKTRVEKIMYEFEKGADIVYSDMIVFSKNYQKYNKRIYPSKDDVVKEMLAFNFLGGFSNVSFSKKIFYDVGKLNESLLAYQDQDLFIRLVLNGKIAYIPEALSFYRINSNSISLNSEKKLKGLENFLENYKELFIRYPESRIKRLENELIYSEKQGWNNNTLKIKEYLGTDISKLRINYLCLKGKMKYIATKYFKMQ